MECRLSLQIVGAGRPSLAFRISLAYNGYLLIPSDGPDEMTSVDHALFGSVKFNVREEHLEFQFKFLSILLVCGAALTGFFLAGSLLNFNKIDAQHVLSMEVFTASSLVLSFLLRGRKEWFLPIAWVYEALCLAEGLSTVVFVTTDELRIFWLVTNVPGVFILLGKRAGWAITLLSVAAVLVANGHSTSPYSQNAVATYSLGMVYFAAFFHIYAARSISYFIRMRESNEQLAFMASHDTLTGVFNARAYYEACERMISAAVRSDSPFSVLFVDLDHFKMINDTHGHAAGDLVLKAVAQALASHLRQSDVLGRIGGEEFSVFLMNTDIKAATGVAETLRMTIENLLPSVGNHPLRVTASIGVAGPSHGKDSILDIQQRADKAMYAAKANGRNRVSIFTAA